MRFENCEFEIVGKLYVSIAQQIYVGQEGRQEEALQIWQLTIRPTVAYACMQLIKPMSSSAEKMHRQANALISRIQLTMAYLLPDSSPCSAASYCQTTGLLFPGTSPPCLRVDIASSRLSSHWSNLVQDQNHSSKTRR